MNVALILEKTPSKLNEYAILFRKYIYSVEDDRDYKSGETVAIEFTTTDRVTFTPRILYRVKQEWVKDE